MKASNTKLNIYKGMIQYILESTKYTLENIAQLSDIPVGSIRSVYCQDQMPKNSRFEISLIKLYKSILNDHVEISGKNTPKYDTTYYPVKMQYISGNGAFRQGHFPKEIMTEEEVVHHFMRKSAVRYFLESTDHNLTTLAKILDIPMEKLLSFDCLTEEEVEKLDLLRLIWEEESGQIPV